MRLYYLSSSWGLSEGELRRTGVSASYAHLSWLTEAYVKQHFSSVVSPETLTACIAVLSLTEYRSPFYSLSQSEQNFLSSLAANVCLQQLVRFSVVWVGACPQSQSRNTDNSAPF